MKVSTPIVGISLVAATATGVLAQAQVPPQLPRVSMINSRTPFQCAPDGTIGVGVRAEDGLAFRLPGMSFGTTGHGRTDELTVCDVDIELQSWFYKWRVAVADVTYSGRLNLTNGVELYRLKARVEFRYVHLENFSPVVQPEVRNMSTAVMARV